jgi:hypothetical protein
MKYMRPKRPSNIITWDDDIPRVAYSEDGIPLLYYLPNMTPQTTVVRSITCILFFLSLFLMILTGWGQQDPLGICQGLPASLW